jgi:hypothetical protein
MVIGMNVKMLLGCCSVVVAFGLVGACGGSDEDDEGSTGGKGGSDSGTGGSTSGGSSGASSGGTSSGGTAGGSTGGASGGTAGAGTGGAGGAAGAATGGTAGAGTGGASATCPTDAPQSGSDCDDSGLWCTFPGQNGNQQQCACFDGNWDCDPCPTAEPQNDDPCQSSPGGGGSQCTYGTNQCVCGGGDWDCAACPATAPADNDDCTLNNQQCGYATTECTCQGFGADLQWNCDTPGGPGDGCPATQPAPGSACQASPFSPPCDYGQGNSCVCVTQQWYCN